jgi:single-strand DNA-binding protein
VAIDAEGEAEGATWARVVVFGGLATERHPTLQKGAEVYVEGKLRLESWTGKDGRERSGLSVAAAKVEVLGRIGFDPYQRKPTETHPPVAHHEFEGQGHAEQDLPF